MILFNKANTMAKPKKLLSTSDPRWNKIKDKYGFVFFINGSYRVYQWDNRPRFINSKPAEPVGIIPTRVKGKTQSEVITALNSGIKAGKKINFIRGTKPKQPQEYAKLPPPEHLIKPPKKYVPQVKPEQPEIAAEEIIDFVLNASKMQPDNTLQRWIDNNPGVKVVDNKNIVYVYSTDAELENLDDFIVVDKSGSVTILGPRANSLFGK